MEGSEMSLKQPLRRESSRRKEFNPKALKRKKKDKTFDLDHLLRPECTAQGRSIGLCYLQSLEWLHAKQVLCSPSIRMALNNTGYQQPGGQQRKSCA